MVRYALALMTGWAGTAAAEEPLRMVGITADLGVPDILHLGLAYRPVDPVRITVAAGTNGIGAGGRLGVSIKVPWDVGPVIDLSVGHFLESDATWLAVQLAGEQAALPVLERVGYSYASARGGLEFGNPKATLYLHVGMTGMMTHVRGLQALADKEVGEGTLLIEDATIRALFPSARVGFIVYFKRKRT